MDICQLMSGLPTDPLPEKIYPRSNGCEHAPNRFLSLTQDDKKLAVKNALRYIPANLHRELSGEFLAELNDYGHIYMYRFKPTFPLYAPRIDEIPAKCVQSAAIIVMLLNNLDRNVAQFPDELVTYGGNGQVLSNWAQVGSSGHDSSELYDIISMTCHH